MRNRAAPAAELDLPADAPIAATVEAAPEPWPTDAVEQIGTLKRLVTAMPLSVDEATARFTGARREIVARHLETLAILGEVREVGQGTYGAAAAG